MKLHFSSLFITSLFLKLVNSAVVPSEDYSNRVSDAELPFELFLNLGLKQPYAATKLLYEKGMFENVKDLSVVCKISKKQQLKLKKNYFVFLSLKLNFKILNRKNLCSVEVSIQLNLFIFSEE